jgi:hypothetical protein
MFNSLYSLNQDSIFQYQFSNLYYNNLLSYLNFYDYWCKYLDPKLHDSFQEWLINYFLNNKFVSPNNNIINLDNNDYTPSPFDY